VVNFFTAGSAGWAGKVLTKLNDEYAGRGLQVIGIDLFDKPEEVQKCIEKFAVKYPVLQGDQATQKAWIGNNKGWATFFVNADGKIVKKIENSINNGLEDPVFRKYADYLVKK
jgi:hypothetical protein